MPTKKAAPTCAARPLNPADRNVPLRRPKTPAFNPIKGSATIRRKKGSDGAGTPASATGNPGRHLERSHSGEGHRLRQPKGRRRQDDDGAEPGRRLLRAGNEGTPRDRKSVV